ncbi:hypothetical protein Pelo_17154 [Pelomyxa schiedti]|nr:hypothetical protein Pelo_17154 [Pelomyxa schiedti]
MSCTTPEVIKLLLAAVRGGNAKATSDILARNPTIDINAMYYEPYTYPQLTIPSLLHEAGSASVVRLLLTSPPPPHQPYTNRDRESGGGTPLSRACSDGREDVVRELLGVVGVDPNMWEPLYWASSCGHAGVVGLLLGHPDTDVNRVGIDGSTPLAVALIHGHLEVAQMIVARGGTVNKESQPKVDKSMGGHDKYELWMLNTHQQVDGNYKLRIRQLEEEVSELNTKLSAMASSLTQLEQNQQSIRKEKSELEAKLNTELKAARNKLKEHTRLETQHNSAKKGWEQLTRILIEQHAEELNQMNKKLQQLQEQQEESNSMEPKTPTTMPELNDAFRLATLFQTQLKKSAPQFLLLQESLEKLSRNLEGATKHNEELASHLQKLSDLKGALERKVTESDATCNKILGKNLTVRNSEAEIQECSRNISSLTKMWGMKGLMAEKNTFAVTEGCEPVDEILLEHLIVPLKPQQDDEQFTPPFQVLCTLTDTLAQLQSCRFDECTKLAGKHTVLSKELSEQETLGCTLHKAIEETQRECSELQRKHKSKSMLQRGLEGDERFIGVPCVWSMLSELLPQAQQAIVDLMVCKATSSGQQRPGLSMTTAGTDICVECEERPPEVELQPCGHVVLCSQCAAVMKKCPDCRAFIKGKVHL